LIAILGGETEIDVLAGKVTRPTGHVQPDAPDPGCLCDELNHLTDEPAQSPAYRCSFHGSP
jgi:hypothetical protein